MTLPGRLILSLSLIALAGCWYYPVARLPVGSAVGSHPAAGCWELKLDRRDTLYWTWPAHVRLDTVPNPPGGRSLSLRIDLRPDSVGHHALYGDWAPYRRTDSIQIIVNHGLAGLDIRLRPRNDTLRGYAGRVSDMGHAGVLGNVLGTRIDCSLLTDRAALLPNKRLKLAARVGY